MLPLYSLRKHEFFLSLLSAVCHIDFGTRARCRGSRLAALLVSDFLLLVPVPFVDLALLKRELLRESGDSRFIPIRVLNELIH